MGAAVFADPFLLLKLFLFLFLEGGGGGKKKKRRREKKGLPWLPASRKEKALPP